MSQPADFKLESRGQGQTAGLTGDWTAVRMGWAGIANGPRLAERCADPHLAAIGRADVALHLRVVDGRRSAGGRDGYAQFGVERIAEERPFGVSGPPCAAMEAGRPRSHDQWQ